MDKKTAVLSLFLAAALALGGCAGKPGSLPNLDEIPGCTQEQLDETLPGRSREELLGAWGEPDGMLSGFYGDIWNLSGEDRDRIILYYDADGVVERAACFSSDGKAASNEARWEYMPSLSSRRPAMPFSFDVPGREIMASCDHGTLISYDIFSEAYGGYLRGASITIPISRPLYWAPWSEEDDTLTAPLAEVTFTVLDDDGAPLHEGTLSITCVEEFPLGAVYSATLESGRGLTLTQNESRLGGILTQSSG